MVLFISVEMMMVPFGKSPSRTAKDVVGGCLAFRHFLPDFYRVPIRLFKISISKSDPFHSEPGLNDFGPGTLEA